MRRFVTSASVAIALLLAASSASAQVVHSLHVGGGIFFPRGIDARVTDDVLVRNFFGETVPLPGSKTDALAFEMNDFIGGRVFGEWNVGIGRHVEVGAGLGYYRQTVPTVYRDLVDEDFNEIFQELRLQIVPVTFHARFMPFGTVGQVQPYVGAGFALLNYRYSETGSFVDGNTLEIFRDSFSKRGTAPGGLLLGGVRFPIRGDVYGIGAEYRYTFGSGDTGGIENGFLADKIDLSGSELNFSFLVRF
jgi:opacity protein-like surface antigen